MLAESDVLYAFAATADGQILCHAGDVELLSERDVVNVAQRPESVQNYHAAILRYRQLGPAFLPRGYAQGRTEGVIDSPVPGIVVFAFGVMPQDVASRDAVDRVEWSQGFRGRVSMAMRSAYGA